MKYLKNRTESEDAAMEIFEVLVKDLPRLPKGSPGEVFYKYTEDGLLEVTAMVGGRTAAATIVHPGGMAEEELDEAAAYVQSVSIHR